MANILDMRVIQEGPRNAIVKLTGYLDSGDVNEQSIIALSAFTNNDPRLFLRGFRIDFIEYSMSAGLEIMLQWNASTPQMIAPIAGRGRFGSKNYGGLLPDTTLPGYDGSINLITTGASLGNGPQGVPQSSSGQIANFTVILEMVKLYKRLSPQQ